MNNQWKMVPVDPTPEMHDAARDWSIKRYGQAIGSDGSSGCYAAMLAAAPVPPAGDVEMLACALRQYRHNSGGDDLIPGYEYEATRRVLTRLTAERDGLQGDKDRAEAMLKRSVMVEDYGVLQSELTKARELLNQWLNMFEGGLKSGDLDSLWNETADYIDPTAHNADESCGQDAEAAKGDALPKDRDALIDLVMRAADAYWYADRNIGGFGAVKWILNEETGALCIYTRGEYGERLRQFVMSLEGVLS